jgi:hypothetical protein
VAEPETVPPASAGGAPQTTKDQPRPPAEPETGPAVVTAPAATGLSAVPGYDLLGELGRGGMGVVYHARQHGLNRPVALKMILAGAHATADDLARFRAEAEAVARLHHPGVIQVYEVGEHGGLPYFSLEYCPGGSLAKQLDGTPWPPAKAARLVEELALAVQAAHAAGIVHRDLKPGNVLAGPDGHWKVSDFGLAKRLDEVGRTQTGAVLGTPSYMAPEQAGGKGRVVGPAADTYALGAILYELLTGRPPFKAATPLDTVLQVVSEEVVPPSRLVAKLPKDLETICLKCLQKEPSKRFASALALAEDLRRYLRGEPIKARPISSLARGWRWCRRNPVAAGALLVFLAAAIISSALALVAAEARGRAVQKAGEALVANTELSRSNTELRESKESLQRTNNQLEVAVARSLLRPLAPQSSTGRAGGSLGDPEIQALWELAGYRGTGLAIRFVEDALQRPITTAQLRVRAQYALHAAVGLDTTSRGSIEATFQSRLENARVGGDEHVDLLLAAVALGGDSSSPNALLAQSLNQAMSDSVASERSDPSLVRLARSRLVLRELQGEYDALAQRFRDAVRGNRGYYDELADALSRVAMRMGPSEGAGLLLRALTEHAEGYVCIYLVARLSDVVDRLGPQEAARVCRQAMTTMSKKATENKLLGPMDWGRCLAVLAPHMEPKEGAAALIQAIRAAPDSKMMGDESGDRALGELALGLAVVARRLEPPAAASVCAEAAAALIKARTKVIETYSISLEDGLVAVAAYLEPKEAARAAAMLRKEINNPNESSRRLSDRGWSRALAALMARMEAEESAAALLQSIGDVAGATALPELTPSPGPRSFGGPSSVPNSQALPNLAMTLARVAGRLERQQAAKTCAQAAAHLVKVWPAPLTGTGNRETITSSTALASLAAHLEPKAAARTLLTAMTENRSPSELRDLALGLAGIVVRLESNEAAATCGRAADILVQRLAKTTDSTVPRLRYASNRRIQQLPFSSTGQLPLSELAQGLAALLLHMEPQTAAKVSRQVAAKLTHAFHETSNESVLPALAQILSVAARLEAKEATPMIAEVVAAIIQALQKASNSDMWDDLAQGLVLLLPHLPEREALPVASQGAGAVFQAYARRYSGRAVALLTGILCREDSSRRSQRLQAAAGATGLFAGRCCLFLAPAVLTPAPEPVPPPLPPQMLVDLLKHPLCVGDIRRLVVLDQLHRHYGRPFADQWEFVRFVQEKRLPLDLTSPPIRFDR